MKKLSTLNSLALRRSGQLSIFNSQLSGGADLSSTTFERRFKKSGAGFTFIELIIVLSVTAIISVIGIVSFVSYNQTQSLNTAAADISNMFNLAKSRAASGVKPNFCFGTLDGYEIRLCGLLGSTCINSDSADYELDVICSGIAISPPVLTGKLPSNIVFNALTNSTVFTFPVLTGGFSGGDTTIVLTGY